jgi:alkanesulfonate monooxygenase SsuD/methylene tetrahydromethanopterin reductase-like flavin-dependent oxidoreductase (luciferase family)
MLEEAVPLIRDLLDPEVERTTHTGPHYRTDRAACVPGPVGGRRLPLWIGGVGPRRTPALAARHADGWNAAYISAEQFGRLSGNLDRACEAVGRDPGTLERTVNLLFMLSTDAAAGRRLSEQLDQQWGEMAPRVKAGALIGSPEEAVETIAAYAEAGATGLNVALRAPWDAEALDAFVDEVMPAVRRRIG